MAGLTARFTAALDQLAKVSVEARRRQGGAVPASEHELHQQLNSLFEGASAEYSREYNEMTLASIQIGWFKRELPKIQAELAERERTNSALRQEIEELKQNVRNFQDATRRYEGFLEELTRVAKTRLNNKSRDELLSYLLVFVPNTPAAAKRTLLTAPVVIPENPFSYVVAVARKGEPAIFPAPAVYVAEWPLLQFERAHPQRFLENASLHDKLAKVDQLGRSFKQVRIDHARFVPEAKALEAQYAPLHYRRNGSFMDNAYYLPRAKSQQQVEFQYYRTLKSNADFKAETASREVLFHMARDFAQDKVKSELISILERMLNVSGLEHVPLNRADAIKQMAIAGRTIALPFDRYQREWRAVLDAQERALNLINKAQGHIGEAARLLAAGSSTGEAEAYIDRVFGDVREETIEFAKIFGAGNGFDNAHSPAIKAAIDQYLLRRRDR